jgi:DNA ligase-1
MKQMFLQQAHTYKPGKHNLIGRYATVKLDGIRCFWDGGVTRGVFKDLVPWANTDKDFRYRLPQIATGLWTRYGNVIHAPDWFLDSLPKNIPLDGELWAGRGRHQYTRSTVSKIIPNDLEWQNIKFGIFHSPNLTEIFHDRAISLKNQYEKEFHNILIWLNKNGANTEHKGHSKTYLETQCWLGMQSFWNDYVHHVKPELIKSESDVERIYNKELELGGEGIIFTEPDIYYTCGRIHGQVKQKPFLTDEATVIGYVSGRKTDLGSKLLGSMGAMIVQTDSGKVFELSGFTDKERTLDCTDNKSGKLIDMAASIWAVGHPGEELPIQYEARHFPRGTRITYKYRELSDDGIPKEARYYRKREVE